jgi:hypothetical protein
MEHYMDNLNMVDLTVFDNLTLHFQQYKEKKIYEEILPKLFFEIIYLRLHKKIICELN